MSSKNSYLLFSTCLSVLALSVPMTSHAGFEWTPPKSEVKSAIPEPVDVKPVMEDKIIPEPMMETNEAEDAVTKHMNEMQVETENTVEPVVEEKPIEKVMQSITMADEEASEEDTSAKMDEMEEAVEHHVAIETEEEVAIEHAMVSEDIIEEEPEDSDIITINPFPLEEAQNDHAEEQPNIIALPSASDKTLEEMTDEDVVASSETQDVVEETAEANSLEDIKWNESATLEGFGFDMPLAVALGQIVPPHYAYSFGRGVNPGALVSWEGGKPWHKVLGESLEAIHVSYDIKDKTIHLKSMIETQDHKETAEDDMAEEASIKPIEENEDTIEQASQDSAQDDIEVASALTPVIIEGVDQEKATPISGQFLQAQKKTLQ